jgi:hypothetical protein
MKDFKDLCPPAMFYFVVSIVTLFIVLMQNLGNTHSYHVGSFSCRVPNTIMVFILKAIYILFWTWILNLICKDGHPNVSWLLVLLPWILLVVMMGMLIINM